MQKISWMMACLVLLALPCQAASWREVATAPASGATVSVDTASLGSREYIATGWIRVDYPEPREKNGYLLNGYSAKWQTNCKDRTYWVSDAWGYRPDAADAVRLYSANQRWLTPEPDSENEVALNALCQASQSIFGRVIDGIGRALSGGS